MNAQEREMLDALLDVQAEIQAVQLKIFKASQLVASVIKHVDERPLPKTCVCAPPSGRDFEGPFDHDENCVTRRHL